MAIQRNPIGLMQDARPRKAAGTVRLPSVKNDVFLKALLETPTREHAPCSGRSDWRSCWRRWGDRNDGADTSSSATAGAKTSAS